jgi:hypothetical protein
VAKDNGKVKAKAKAKDSGAVKDNGLYKMALRTHRPSLPVALRQQIVMATRLCLITLSPSR